MAFGGYEKKMKILMLANHLNYGGISAYMLNLSKALHQKEGLRVVVGSRGGDLEEEFKNMGIVPMRLPLTTKCEVSPKVFFAAWKIQHFIKREKIDLIHANTRVTQVLAALVSFASGIPYISTCHGYFKTRLSRRLLPCWGSKVIAISDQVQEHLLKDFHLQNRRVALIYNGVDPERFQPKETRAVEQQKKMLGLAPDKKIIGHIGRLSSVKGQKYLILAAGELMRKRRDFQLLIVGDGEEGKELKKLIAAEKSLEDIVVLKPSVADTSGALSVMDIFVMPSLQEGLGLSILEAQAQGVPVVASRVGGIPTAIEDNVTGLLCPAADAHALAFNIEKILDNPTLRESIINKAKQNIKERFSVSLMAAKTRAVYEEVLCVK